MSTFNAEKHIEDTAKIAEALGAILGNTGKLIKPFVKGASEFVSSEIDKTVDIMKEAATLLKGKPSSFIEYTYEDVTRQGKFKMLQGKVAFLEKKEVLQIPHSLKSYLTDEDIANLKNTGHLNRVIYVDEAGTARAKYISLDKDLNRIATLSADRFRLKDEVMGVKLTEDEKAAILDGKSVLLKGLVNPKSPEKPFDAIVTIDAAKLELSFQKPTGVPKLIGGKELTEEQRLKLEKGEVIIVNDLYSKEKDKYYDAYLSIDKNKGEIEILPFNAPKHLLGVALSEEQIQSLRKGEQVFIDGMKNRKGDLFSTQVMLEKEKGFVFLSKDESLAKGRSTGSTKVEDLIGPEALAAINRGMSSGVEKSIQSINPVAKASTILKTTTPALQESAPKQGEEQKLGITKSIGRKM